MVEMLAGCCSKNVAKDMTKISPRRKVLRLKNSGRGGNRRELSRENTPDVELYFHRISPAAGECTVQRSYGKSMSYIAIKCLIMGDNLLHVTRKYVVEQIQAEYKARALQYHPDKNAGDKEAEAKFQLLNEAKETLCNPEKRINYDKWRTSGISISYKQWLNMKDSVHQSMHWSTPKTKDRMLESGGGSGPSSLGAASPAHRRASEGGANLHWAGRGAGAAWAAGDAPSEVVSRFRNYEI